MADWNPAEIIGNNPNPLDYSLYDFFDYEGCLEKRPYKNRISKSREK